MTLRSSLSNSTPNRATSRLTNTTPFPNFLLDEIMPALKDTEWRLLCVVVRQTLGWQEKSGIRRTRDWLTQRQLKQRTGRNSEALSKAITALIEVGLLEVRDGRHGNPLATSAARRRHQGKLYFGLHPSVLARLRVSSSLATGIAQPDISPSKISPPNSQKPKNEQITPMGEFRKSNTTKETGTKETVTKTLAENVFGLTRNMGTVPSTCAMALNTADQHPSGRRHSILRSAPLRSAPLRKPENSDSGEITLAAEITPEASDRQFQRLLQLYQASFVKLRPKTETPKTAPLDRSNLAQILAGNDERVLERLLQTFFIRDIGYVRQQGYSLQAFVSSINILKLLQ